MINKLMWFFAFAFTLFAFVGCTTQQKESSEFKVQDSESAERIQKLIKQLDDNDQKVRENATNELILIGKPAVPYVEKALSIRDAEVVWRAKVILNVLGVKFSDSLLKWYPDIYRDLSTDNAKMRFKILQKITEMDENSIPQYNVMSEDVAGVIGVVLRDGGKGLSEMEKQIICAIAEGAHCGWRRKVPASIPYIRNLLKDRMAYVRGCAAEALATLGAKEAIPDIKDLLNDKDKYVRSDAAIALGELGAKELIPEIRKLLKDNDTYVHEYAALALGKLGAKEAIPEIRELLNDDNAFVRSGAAIALGELGAKDAIDDIKTLLLINESDTDNMIHGCAGIALAKLGSIDYISEEVVENIKSILANDGSYACYTYYYKYAEDALRQLGVSEEEIEKMKNQK